MLEPTFNHDGRTSELGTGYGHIAIGVDDLEATPAELKAQGIERDREPYPARAARSSMPAPVLVRADEFAGGECPSGARPLEE